MSEFVFLTAGQASSGTHKCKRHDVLGSPENRRRPGFTLVELLVVITIIGILIALLLPAVQAAREAARRMECSNNLKQIMLGVLNYESQYKCFPISFAHYDEGDEDGNGMSWMTGILPFIEEKALYDSMDYHGSVEAGLGVIRPGNLEYIKQFPSPYYCPSDGKNRKLQLNVWRLEGTPFAPTNYAGVSGPHDGGNTSIFGGLPDCHNYSVYGTEECTGCFWRHSWMAPVAISSIRDGTSNTLAVGEVVPEYSAFIAWALGNGVHQRTSVPINYLNPAYDPADPLPVTRYDWPNHGFHSRHPGGAQFAYADGHVSFLSETIDRDLYRGLSTRDMGETVTPP